jgi:uncharacterized protein (TIRG00374 family)
MNRTARKTLILLAKAAIAVVLLAWVLGQVHWRDYVKAVADGRTYPVLDDLGGQGKAHAIRIAVGPAWSWRPEVRPAADFAPLPGGVEVARPGFVTSLVRINVPLAVLGALGFGASVVLTAVRWWILLKIQDIHIRLWESVRLTFLGQFFNSVVPGTVGGDLVKAYYVAKHTPKTAAVLVSVFVDRLFGLVGLAVVAAVMLAVVLATGIETFQQVRQPVICVGAVLAGVAALLAFLFSGGFRRALRLERLYQRLPVAHQLLAAGDAVRLYRRRLGSMTGTVVLTFAAHMGFVGFVALTGLSLSLPTAWYNYFVYVPLVYIIGSVPLTPGGVGWIENWYVKFFQTATCGASAILVLALLARLIPVLWGLPGAVVAITGSKVPAADSMQAELAQRENDGKGPGGHAPDSRVQ